MVAVLLALAASSLWAEEASTTAPALAGELATHEQLAAGPWRLRLLPGQEAFTFTMYGCPGNVDELKQLVAAMREKGLGNGFDPGPAARAGNRPLFEYLATVGWPVVCYPGWADMQVKDGRCRLGDEDEAALGALERAGVFCAIQLGEWGYFFHNLSTVESWWRGVYGKDFETYRHLMEPPGLKGYQTRPTTRRECYEVVRDYYATRNRHMRGRNMSVTGHSHYETYAAEWGSPVIGLELGENIAFTQSKMAFARGAARQWNRSWSVQVSPWFHGSCTTRGPLRMEGRYARGLDAGHSLSFYERMWLHAWFAGAATVTPENSIGIFFDEPGSSWKLTEHGRKAAGVFAFMRAHDRGIPYTPVAIVLDHLAGYNAYQRRPWGILENTPGGLETYDLFQEQLFPGSDHIHGKSDPDNPEASYLRPTPFGETCDVLLSSAEGKLLQSYPAILLVGDITFDAGFVEALCEALRGGSEVLIHSRHATALGSNLARLQQNGRVEVLAPWTNPATNRPSAISNARLRQLTTNRLPVVVEGDPVQYQVNRNRRGWVVEMVHNGGVVKRPDQQAAIDPKAVARVTLRPRIPVHEIRQWRSRTDLTVEPPLAITIQPGQSAFVELIVEP